MSQKQCDDREEESGEHITHLQDLAEGRVDADTENEGGSYKRKLGDESIACKRSGHGCNGSNTSLVDKDWDSGTDRALAVDGGVDKDDDKVQDRFCREHGNVMVNAVLDGAHDCHGADADDKGCVYETIHKGGVAV